MRWRDSTKPIQISSCSITEDLKTYPYVHGQQLFYKLDKQLLSYVQRALLQLNAVFLEAAQEGMLLPLGQSA